MLNYYNIDCLDLKMTLLPNYESAIIPDEKIYDYCLNPLHERGRHKAKVFKQVLGITNKDGELLKEAIFAQINKFDVTEITVNKFGVLYTLPMKISIFDKEAEVITAWIIENETQSPRLTTCYINK